MLKIQQELFFLSTWRPGVRLMIFGIALWAEPLNQSMWNLVYASSIHAFGTIQCYVSEARNIAAMYN